MNYFPASNGMYILKPALNMAYLRHENIKVLENALEWRKNGILRSISRGFTAWAPITFPGMADRSFLRLSPCRARI